MNKQYDEISLSYWKENNEEIKTKKRSFMCTHNGNNYGDTMTREAQNGVKFVHYVNGEERVFSLDKSEAKWSYIDAVQEACNYSNITLNNYLNVKNKMMKVFPKDEVATFSNDDIKTTRIKDDNDKIVVVEKNFT